MKKILSLFIIPIISLFFVTEVKADTYTEDFRVINMNRSVEENISNIKSQKDIISKLYENLYSKYINEYSNLYPYYTISFSEDAACFFSDCSSHNTIELYMYLYTDLPTITLDNDAYNAFSPKHSLILLHYYDNSEAVYVLPITEQEGVRVFQDYEDFFYFNFDAKLNLLNHSSVSLTLNKDSNYILSLNNGDVFPSLHDYFDLNILSDPNSSGTTYVEVDLNKYSYIALSLKNYNVNAFDSVIFVKGRACPTVVYNYGLEEKPNTDRCNIPFDNFSPIRYRISDNDIKNHFIYYFKAYDTSIENKIKIDSSIFNVHYITEEQKNNPILNINGYNYSAIPFDKLSSTANKNEAENFVPGASEDVSFSDIFSAPTELLKDIWSSISNVFSLITNFISLLPIELRSLLYAGFVLALTLGIIKILL